MTYILMDTQNLYIRSGFAVRSNDIEMKIAMAFNIMFLSIAKMWRNFDGTHVVFCFDNQSWRYGVYPPYKAHRRQARANMDVGDREDNERFLGGLDEFRAYLEKSTNVTVLNKPGCEADDFIARWIQNHPKDKHIIISSDSDFYQLLNDQVTQYNGISKHHITIDGVFDEKGNAIIDKKTKLPKVIDPAWILFEKCVRGDSSDNIFSSCPGVRTKGSTKRPGLIEAYNDRNSKGYIWNNFFLQRWPDHNGIEHIVLDDYNRNRDLIDLTRQPEHIKKLLDDTIIEEVQRDPVSQIGFQFLRFCGKYDLQRISNGAEEHISYLKEGYQ